MDDNDPGLLIGLGLWAVVLLGAWIIGAFRGALGRRPPIDHAATYR